MMLPAFVLDAIKKIQSYGHKAYVVGGCVRDFLLEKKPSDWDVATSAQPEEIINIFSNRRTIPTGLSHGTITLLTDSGSIEITTFRIDGEYQDHRHPRSVTFSKNIADDLCRRDFTINAMAYSPSDGLLDMFDGQTDLMQGIIRCVGNPQARFEEDALRIMRALRFSAALGFKIEENTAKAILDNAQLLQNIATERICSEFSKLILADNPSSVLIDFRPVFELVLGTSLKQNEWEQVSASVSRAERNLSVRLGILFDDQSPSNILKKLRFDNATIKSAGLVSKYLHKDIPLDLISVKKSLSTIGVEGFKLILSAKAARFPEEAQLYSQLDAMLTHILNSQLCYNLGGLAISGDDLKTLPWLSGRKIGEMLNLLLDAVITEKCQNEKDHLLAYAKKKLS